MKTITTKGGQIIEVLESRKEALYEIEMLDFDPEWWSDDDSLYIEYKDGSYFYIGTDGVQEGKFRKTNIKTVIYSNSATYMVYGGYEIYNIDNIEEKYSEENDSEDKCWNIA